MHVILFSFEAIIVETHKNISFPQFEPKVKVNKSRFLPSFYTNVKLSYVLNNRSDDVICRLPCGYTSARF